jgi:flagellum-specific ATP synthase
VRPTFGVGPGHLGRVLDGLGVPLDGGGVVAVERETARYGHPINPLARAPIRRPLADLGCILLSGRHLPSKIRQWAGVHDSRR